MFTAPALLVGILCGSPEVDVAVVAGATEVVALPDNIDLGTYVYGGASLIVPTSQVTVVPTLTVEWSPEYDRWGGVASVAVDYAVSARLGVDAILSLLHDQSGTEWGDALYFGGAGAGVSLFFGRLTVSPSVTFYRGINLDGWSYSPALNLAWLL